MRLIDFFARTLDIKLQRYVPKGAALDAKELRISDMLPYTHHYDVHTVMTVDNALVQVIKLDGLQFEALTDAQLNRFKHQRNTLWRAIANSNRGIYTHLIRRRKTLYPEGEQQTWFAKYFDGLWKERFAKKEVFVNELYITIVRNRYRQGAAGWLDRFCGLFKRGATQGSETFDEQIKDIDAAAHLITEVMADYGPKRLRIVPQEDGEYSEIGRFFNYLFNLEDVPVRVASVPLNIALPKARINFSRDVVEIKGSATHRWGAMLSMKEWPEKTDPKMMDKFLRMPVEFIITQSFFFLDRIAAEKNMKEQARRMQQADDIASDQIAGITEELKELGSGRAVNGLHHLTMMVHVPFINQDNDYHAGARATQTSLETAVKAVEKGFVSLAVVPVREAFGLETFFWSQLPGQHQGMIGRRGRISTKNFAGFASLHNFSYGKYKGNLWGPCVTVLETEGGTPHYFNFHREMEGVVSAHTKVAAETGVGKTTIIAALIAQADKFSPKVLWIDRNFGAKVFMSAMGASQTVLTTQRETGWNPLQLPDTTANRAYLLDLLVAMRTCYGGVSTAAELDTFKHAIEENYHLALVDRRLRNIAWVFGQGELNDAMKIWYGNGANAQVFDNAQDSIDFTNNRYYCYEMNELMRDATARPELPVLLSYVFYRFEASMEGSPHIIVLDEAQHLIKTTFWLQKIEMILEQFRRRNCLMIFITPDAKALYSYTTAVNKQCATSLYLPTSGADKKDYIDNLDLTTSEYLFIRDTHQSERKFLLRRGRESARIVFNLNDVSQVIPVLSGSARGVVLMEKIMAELGTQEPAQWVPEFIAQALQHNTHNLKAA